MSEYLSDQGKRAHLLDYLASLYDNVADLSGVLLVLDEPVLTNDERKALNVKACTMAMNVLADWKIIHPMMLDLYHEPVDTPANISK